MKRWVYVDGIKLYNFIRFKEKVESYEWFFFLWFVVNYIILKYDYFIDVDIF